MFLRYLDRPSRTWRYLADTALWVYLIHQPLVIIALALFRPLHLTWWAQTAAVSTVSVAAALLLYEAIVRPTPLVQWFGPASLRRTGVR
jgi:peptidoglycan/LPS O-acetylase OafA/YrhL